MPHRKPRGNPRAIRPGGVTSVAVRAGKAAASKAVADSPRALPILAKCRRVIPTGIQAFPVIKSTVP